MLPRAFRLVLFAVLVAFPGCKPRKPAAPPPSMESPLLGQAVPEFDRPTLAGDKVDIAALRGKVVVVKFFAEYCQPCKVTLPEAQKLASEHADVAFVGVSEDEYESKARELITLYGLSFPVVHDRGQVLAGRFRVREMPVTFVVDTSGVVRWVGGPGQQEGDLEKAIAAIK